MELLILSSTVFVIISIFWLAYSYYRYRKNARYSKPTELEQEILDRVWRLEHPPRFSVIGDVYDITIEDFVDRENTSAVHYKRCILIQSKLLSREEFIPYQRWVYIFYQPKTKKVIYGNDHRTFLTSKYRKS